MTARAATSWHSARLPTYLLDGRGTGFCALRTKFDYVFDDVVNEAPPLRTGAARPRNRVSHPQHRLNAPSSVLEDQEWLWLPNTKQETFVFAVVVPALDHDPADLSILDNLDDPRKARRPGGELRYAIPTNANDHERGEWHPSDAVSTRRFWRSDSLLK